MAFEAVEEGLGFLAEAGLFGLVFYLPGEVEVGPGDIWKQR